MNAAPFRKAVARVLILLNCAAGSVVAADGAGLVTPAAAPTTSYDSPNSASRVTAFAKLPNWSGFWEQFDIGPSGTPDRSAVKRATDGPPPQFTTAWQQQMKTEKKHDPVTDRLCTFGFPMLLESSPLIFEIISVPEETAMIFNMREVRHIYTDGLGHAPEDVRLTTPWGDSTGRWDAHTLEIETVSSDGLFRFRNAAGQEDNTHLSEKAVYHERLRMVDADTLEDSFSVEDADALSAPYRFTRRYHRVKNMMRIVEELDCESSGTNDRNPIVNGKWTLSQPK